MNSMVENFTEGTARAFPLQARFPLVPIILRSSAGRETSLLLVPPFDCTTGKKAVELRPVLASHRNNTVNTPGCRNTFWFRLVVLTNKQLLHIKKRFVLRNFTVPIGSKPERLQAVFCNHCAVQHLNLNWLLASYCLRKCQQQD